MQYDGINVHMNTPVSDPFWPDDFFPFELLNFVVGQISGDDVCSLRARVVDVELATVQHHQSAQLICTWLCSQRTGKGF